MAWTLLVIAGLCEIAWTVGLKYSHGFSRLWPSVATIVALALSAWLLAQAVRTIPIGTAYAVWTGIGVVGAAVFGMLLFGESRDPLRVACMGLIVLGIVGLRVL